MMESTALDSWSPYHVSCPWSIQGLLQSQYINTTALVLQLLKQKSPCCFYLCPHQQAVQEQCWHFYNASQQTNRTSSKIAFYQGFCNKTWFLPWNLPLLPSFTRKDTDSRGNTNWDSKHNISYGAGRSSAAFWPQEQPLVLHLKCWLSCPLNLESFEVLQVIILSGGAQCQVRKQQALLKAQGSRSLQRLLRGYLEMQQRLKRWEHTESGFLKKGK